MSKPKFFLVDTNVLSDYHRQSRYAEDEIGRLQLSGDPAICVVSYIEFMYSMPKMYRNKAKKFLESFEFLPTLPDIDDYLRVIANDDRIKNTSATALLPLLLWLMDIRS